MKRALLAVLVLVGAWSCVTFAPAPPVFHIEDMPQSLATRLTLDQRLAADEVWADLRVGRADRALSTLDKLGKDHPAYAVGMGFVELTRGDLAAAEASFKESLARFPDMTPARAGLAQLYEAKGEKGLALAEYAEILKGDPENRWAKPRFEALRGQGVQALLDEAAADRAAGKKDEARRALLKALDYDPASAEANYLLGLDDLERKDDEAAVRHLSAFLEKETGDKERRKTALRALAELSYRDQEFGRSLDDYQKLLELDPGDKAAAARVEELKAKLGVFELPSQYGMIASQEAITREDLAALVCVKFKDFLDVPAKPTEILVDIATSWAQKFIIQAASAGIMSGYDNHTFQPKRVINRAELAETVSALMDFLKGRGAKFVPLIDARKVTIADVAADSYYYAPILKVVACQVMDLTPQRTFEPERAVPGREAVRVLDVVLGLAR
ncbi:MAG TPA: S-layer homology domain-containing protein [Terriglobales bacterium]|nr:S-layer homology domain-containing protein [Terriglobales bacterium]